ncbi:MAG: hypothetical protein E7643_04910, partial [Ruminococcaceae bacterium]|nr:hypothetical protein [Oscillospiraceae bacterium]
MKRRWMATLLLLAMLLGTFGCAGVTAPKEEAPSVQDGNFIPADRNVLLSTEENAAQLGDLINLAATDSKDKPLYQIVYNISSSLRVKEQCEALAADIADATGVELPILHSSEPTDNPYELMVGKVARSETVDVIDGFDLEDTDFTIRIIGTRVLIYAPTDQALMSAVIFFMDQLAQRDAATGMYGISADTNYTYEHTESPAMELLGLAEEGKAYDFKLSTGLNMYTFVRLSFTGNAGWRIQTKYRETVDFDDDGAAQTLAYSLGEYDLGTEDARFYREKLSLKDASDTVTLTASDGSRVEIGKGTFGMTFYTPSGKVANVITDIAHNAGGSLITGLLNEGEAVYGTGERFNRANQRGNTIEMFTKDIWSQSGACYMVIPLLCFSRGSGVFLNIYEHMMLSLGVRGSEDEWSASVTGAGIDCYIYTTEQIEDVIGGYSKLSGYAGMPEEWTYGMLVCAYGPDLSQKWTSMITPYKEDGRGEGVYNMIANMEAHDLPWTGVLAEGWGPYSQYKHEDLKELCDYVHSYAADAHI